MSDYNRTFLAFDYGERRIGVAKSDPMGIIASALITLEVRSKKEGLKKMIELIDEYTPDAIIYGYPLLNSGDKSKKCFVIDKIVETIKQIYKNPIYLIDEQYSSQEAAGIIHAHNKKTGSDKKRIDRLAAVIILNRFLEENPK